MIKIWSGIGHTKMPRRLSSLLKFIGRFKVYPRALGCREVKSSGPWMTLALLRARSCHQSAKRGYCGPTSTRPQLPLRMPPGGSSTTPKCRPLLTTSKALSRTLTSSSTFTDGSPSAANSSTSSCLWGPVPLN